ncbi:MAG: hypothetical protein V1839_02610 [archaeon]
MMDEKTWGWIKVLAGLLALWFTWKTPGFVMGMNVYGAIVLIAVITLIGGAMKATEKKGRR